MQTRAGKHLNRSNAFIIVNNIYAKALIAKKELHLLRHTFSYEINRQRNKPCSHTKNSKACKSKYNNYTQKPIIIIFMSKVL